MALIRHTHQMLWFARLRLAKFRAAVNIEVLIRAVDQAKLHLQRVRTSRKAKVN
jgi:hypothetical protein